MKTLIKIQSELKAPKNQKNSFGNYNYRSCEDILEAVKPLLKENECLLTISDSIEERCGKAFVKATATFIHEDFKHSVDGFARHAETKKGMDDSQITGSTSSYARKYALNGLFCIDDTKDSDATNKHETISKSVGSYKFGNGDVLPWVSADNIAAMIKALPTQKAAVITSLLKYKWSKDNKVKITKALDDAK